jgi:rare lipoprotein A
MTGRVRLARRIRRQKQARRFARGRAIPRAELRAAAKVAAVAAVLLGCATASSRGARTPARAQDGRASYYARTFDGHKTASGERYDPERMTAAHPTLPFGTWIRVSRPEGPSVEVRVNDRCGCGGGRIVDLSQVAARKLGMIRAGVVRVHLEVIARPNRS